MNFLLKDVAKNDTNQGDSQKPCTGLVFRFSTSLCVTQHNGLLQRQELRLLKRKSCPGCEECGWIMDCIKEDIYLDGGKDSSMFSKMEHGKLYIPHFTWHKDWETGIEDDYDLDFVEYTE